MPNNSVISNITSALQKSNDAKRLAEQEKAQALSSTSQAGSFGATQSTGQIQADYESNKDYAQSKDGVTRALGTVAHFENELFKGAVLNTLDEAFDWSVSVFGWVGTLFGQSDQWAKDLISYDWQDQAIKYINPLEIGNTVVQAITRDKAIDKTLGNTSYIYDSSEENFITHTKAEQFVGSIAPAIALGVLTGGASLGAQAAAQGALAFVQAGGQGVEQAISEGASSGEALGYGTLKGTVSGALSAGTAAIGGSVSSKIGGSASQKAGDIVGNLAKSRGGNELLWGKIGEVAARAGIQGGTAAVNTMIDPLERQITFDQQAISNAYGTGSGVADTFKRAGEAFLLASATTAVLSGAQEIVSYRSDKQAYEDTYFQSKMVRSDKQLQDDIILKGQYDKQLESVKADLKSGKYSPDEASSVLDKITQKYLSLSKDMQSRLEADIPAEGDMYASSKAKMPEAVKPIIDSAKNTALQSNTIADLIRRYTGQSSTSAQAQGSAGQDTAGLSSASVQSGQGAGNAPEGNLTVRPDSSESLTQAAGALSGATDASASKVKVVYSGLTLGGSALKRAVDGGIPASEIAKVMEAMKPSSPSGKQKVEIGGKAFAITAGDDGSISSVAYDKSDSFSTEAVGLRNSDPSSPLYVDAQIIKDAAQGKQSEYFRLSDAMSLSKKWRKDAVELFASMSGKDIKTLSTHSARLARYMFEQLDAARDKGKVGRISDDAVTEVMAAKASYEEKGKTRYLTLGDMLKEAGEYDKYEGLIRASFANFITSKGNPTTIKLALDRFARISESLKSDLKEYKERIGETRKLTRAIDRARRNIVNDAKYNDIDELQHNISGLVAQPFKSLRSSKNGIDARDAVKELRQLLEAADKAESDGKTTGLDDDVRSMIEQFIDDAETEQADGTASITASTMKEARQILLLQRHLEIEAMKKDAEVYVPMAKASAKAIESRLPSKNILAKHLSDIIKALPREAASVEGSLYSALGKNILTDFILKTDRDANDKYMMYSQDHKYASDKKFSDLGLKLKDLDRKVEEGGLTLTLGEWGVIYQDSLCGEQSNNVIAARNGYRFTVGKDENTKVGWRDDLFELAKKAMDDNPSLKSYEDWARGSLNGEVRKDYIKYTDAKSGGLSSNVISEGEYYPLQRDTKGGHIGRGHMVDFKPYNYGKSRTSDTKSGRLVSSYSKSVYENATDMLARELYLRPAVKEVDSILNTKLDSSGTTLAYMVKNSPGGEKAWKIIEDLTSSFMHQKTGTSNGISRFLNFAMGNFATGALGANLSTPVMQVPSLFTNNIISNKVLLRYPAEIVTRIHSKAFKTVVDKLNSMFAAYKYRWKTLQAASGNVTLDTLSKANGVMMSAITLADHETINLGVAALEIMGEIEGYGKPGTDTNLKYVTDHFMDFIDTQIANVAYQSSRIKNGADGEFIKIAFGNFVGATSRALSWVVESFSNITTFHGMTSEEVEREYDEANSAFEEADNKYKKDIASFEKASRKAKDLEEDLDADEDAVKEAEKKADEAKAKAEESADDFSDKKAEKEAADWKKAGFEKFVKGGKTTGQIAKLASSLIAMGIMYVLMHDFSKKVYGQKEWSDFDPAEMAKEVALQSTVAWIPVLGQFISVMQGYDMQIPVIESIQGLTEGAKAIFDYIQDPSDANGMKTIRSLVMAAQYATGVPVKNLYKLTYGVLKNFNVESAIKANNILYGVSQANESQSLKDAVSSGDKGRAKAEMSVILETYKAGKASDGVVELITALYSGGYDAMPRTRMESYTDNDGNKALLTQSETDVFVNAYSKANSAADDMISRYTFKALEDEQKAYAVKWLYNAYHSYASYKALGNGRYELTSISGRLLAYTGGKIGLSKMAAPLAVLQGFTATKRMTRKEQAVRYINSLYGFTQEEKLLLLVMAGYSVDTNAEQRIKTWLEQKGMSSAEADGIIK